MKRRFYAGVGSRATPLEICAIMTEIAKRLAKKGFTLRSGGAEGADEAFERGVGKGLKEIYLPWPGFRNNPSTLVKFPPEIMLPAMEFTSRYHPKWEACNSAHRKLHARNAFQVMGVDLKTPVDYVICWTVDGKDSGGTGQAIRIAQAHGIPVINLFNESHIDFALQLE